MENETKRELAAEWTHISKICEWEENPRFNEAAIDAVADSIKKFGFSSPIVARKEDGRIIAGHTRFKAAQQIGLEIIPVRFMDLSEQEANALALADNRLGEISSWDDAMLGQVLEKLKEENFEMEILGFSEQVMNQLLGDWEDPFWGDEFEGDNPQGEDGADVIEDNGHTIIYITVPVANAHDAKDLIAEALTQNDITHQFRLK